ncbi:retropepsin-like aspartic protease [Asaia bogorensis]|uniref:retropepsin-like aspartic protease n=1 Tax=Asaia bogorensis TaxID=91915 RepID=UPI000EFA40A0|nr:retropepsin-like aspartic protease [Asaia bogorensis]
MSCKKPLMRVFPFMIGLVLLTGCDDQPPLQPGQCEIRTLGRLRLRSFDAIPVVEARIDGKPVLFMVDTGAFNSVIFKKNASMLSLNYIGATAQVRGVHGMESSAVVRVDRLDLGSGATTDHAFVLTESMAPRTPKGLPPIVGLLGAELLMASDLVIDMPHHAMYMLDMRRCPYITPYWQGTVHKIPIERDWDDNKVRLTFTINGSKPIPAIFDTGSSNVLLPYPLAHDKLGITRRDLRKDPSSTDSMAVGEDKVTSYHQQFDHLDLGDFRINNAWVTIDDADNIDHALFGARFLHHTRIWLTTKDVMYVQHVSEMKDAPPIPITPVATPTAGATPVTK